MVEESAQPNHESSVQGAAVALLCYLLVCLCGNVAVESVTSARAHSLHASLCAQAGSWRPFDSRNVRHSLNDAIETAAPHPSQCTFHIISSENSPLPVVIPSRRFNPQSGICFV